MKPSIFKTNILEGITNLIPVIAAFLVPIFFLPVTTEFFSFNKLALLTIMVLVMLLILAIKTLLGKRLEITRSFIDLPLVILLGVLILSTVFSVSKTTSIWGTQGRWLGIFATMMIVAFFYLTTPSLKEVKNIKRALLALSISATISSFVSILSYYKLYIGSASFVKIQNFTLTGSVVDAIILAAIGVVLAFSLALHEKAKQFKPAYLPMIAINFYFVAITGSVIGWVMVALGLLMTLALISRSKFITEKSTMLFALAVIVPLLALVFIPKSRHILVDKGYPIELKLPVNESWFISTATIQNYPILATGPSTFDLNFTRFKPLSMNQTELWSARFDKPANEVFNIISTIGILGLAAAIFLAVRTIKFVYLTKNVKDENGLWIEASILVALMMVSFIFTFASIMTTFLFFLSIGMIVGLHSASSMSRYTKPLVIETVSSLSSISGDSSIVSSSQYTRYIMSIPAFVILAFLGFISFKNYTGEYFMRKALVATATGNSADAYKYHVDAIKYNPSRDSYYQSFARVDLAIATSLAAKKDLTDADKSTIQTLVSESIRNARVATEAASPLNVDNWETRAVVYRNIGDMAANAIDWAIGSYNTAIQLDPTNPRLRLDLGGIYFSKGDYLSAANLFRQATSLKSDYANAHFNFALALANLKQYDQAKSELEITKMLVAKGSDDEKAVDTVLSQLPAAQQAAQEAAKPTVEQLTGAQNTTKQETLTKAGTTNQNTPLTPKVLPSVTPTPTATPTPTPTPTPVKK